MKTIPIEEVSRLWTKFAEADEEQSRVMAAQMMETQPFVMVYLLAMDENLYGDDERGKLMELGAIVHGVMAENRRLRQVTDTDLEAAEEANIRMLEEYDADSEFGAQEATLRFARDYNQMPLLSAVIEALMEENRDAPDLAPETLGNAVLYLKTVIDCLDQ